MNTIQFSVSNPFQLKPGVHVQHQFTRSGGTIGSTANAGWLLNDMANSIEPIHCEIIWVSQQFCLRDSSNQTRINGNKVPLGSSRLIALNDLDEIQLGEVNIRVHFSFATMWQFRDENLTLIDSYEGQGTPHQEEAVSFQIEPVDQLIENRDHSLLENPVVSTTNNGAAQQALIKGDCSDSRISESEFMEDTQYMELPNVPKPTHSTNEQGEKHNDHILTGPMFQGLGVELDQSKNVDQLHLLSQELGQCMQNAIRGLQDVHQQLNQGRFKVASRNLRPIEDNPIKLGLDYSETVKTLFDSQKSFVHLSAPAAVEESLQNVIEHNDATQHAISEALSQLLVALSPPVLHRRFQRYQGGKYQHDNQLGDNAADAWSWQMYQHYHQELTANHQQGFEKLFWEIFEQAYDKKIRTQQVESKL
ncbi:type VI secretion system-associated FHA domain protein TagH [Vibrio intestinalis]|uniref:type VI secretion system-associated FHA domain protein TagH n=1 Tax=Vibrio intestinalis TaxID=2933291 RepID=UPI0021A2CA31|nr:type VI secretion system-associated FHA domain protein TagH [Vibrio intestinalis]